MIERTSSTILLSQATRWPIVTVTGPRQAGKTTLCRAVFPRLPYVSLEALDRREQVLSDPRGFFAEHTGGAILDELQRAPELASYLQELVDADPRPGRFILTGSQHLGLTETVSQSLAGRTALLNLLPLGYDELQRFADAPRERDEVIRTGGYPRIHDQHLPANEWLGSYVGTYVERDVRQVLDVGDLAAFQTFLGLCAGRSAQLINLSALASEAGITHPTARAWLSVLEAGFVIFRVQPWFRSVNKRLVKTPKLYFYDTGLLCYLLGIRTREHLAQHPLRGAIFETWCVSEVLKSLRHHGQDAIPYFYRDRRGAEVDLLLELGGTVRLIEIKAGQTIAADFFTALTRVGDALLEEPTVTAVDRVLIYGGDRPAARGPARVLGWPQIASVDWLANRIVTT